MKLFNIFVALICAAEFAAAVRVDFDCSASRNLCSLGFRVKMLLEEWYPTLREKLNAEPIDNIFLLFDPDNHGVAGAGGNHISASVDYYSKHMDDLGSFIHEMVHIIQGYPGGCPGWIVEGIADYYRYFEYEPERKVVRKPSPGSDWTNGSPYFFNYMKVNYRDWDMVYWVNNDCRGGYYDDGIWQKLTGKTLRQLYDEMMERG